MSDSHQEPFDLVVIGGGTAGIVAAKTAARLGARALLIERERTGGDCLWTGCVPSKSLISAAKAAATARNSRHLGITTEAVRVDFASVMAHVHAAIAQIQPIDSIETLNKAGVEVITGDARFTGSDRLRVGSRDVHFRQAVIATGAAPSVPPIPGLADVAYLTSDTVWGLTALPERLAVLGGGSIGVELGQAFARLGSQVAIIEGAERLIPREDPDAARLLTESLKADGVEVRTGLAVEEVSGRSLRLADGANIEFTHLLVAVGRTPRSRDLGLAEAGVKIDQRGYVTADTTLRTSNPRIWVAGDVSGHPQFTHVAGSHGSLASSNAVLGVRRSIDLSAVPRVTYTDPEIAAVGVDTTDLPPGHQVLAVDHEDLDRAIAEGHTNGWSKLVIDSGGKIVGAAIVGPRAGESLGEATLAVSLGLKTRQFGAVMHPYPTYNDGPINAALQDLQARLRKPSTQRVFGALAAARRSWIDKTTTQVQRNER